MPSQLSTFLGKNAGGREFIAFKYVVCGRPTKVMLRRPIKLMPTRAPTSLGTNGKCNIQDAYSRCFPSTCKRLDNPIYLFERLVLSS
jgi:hypothetical protein